MPEEKSLSIPINSKTIGTIISVIMIASGIIGTWYSNSYKLDQLEERMATIESSKYEALNAVKTDLEEKITRTENESKERDNKLEAEHKENIDHLTSKMEQIEETVHGTQLTVGSIAQDIKNVGSDLSEIKDDIKTIRRDIRRKTR